MKSRFFARLMVGLFLCASFAHADGVKHYGLILRDNGRPAGGAFVRVCQAGSTGTTLCTPTASIYSDAGLTVPIASSIATADEFGNYSFYMTCGVKVDLVFYGFGLTTRKEAAVPVPCASGSTGGAWGEITGTLSDQTDLQAALDAKLEAGDNIATATALAANGSNCAGGISFALGVSATGVGECGDIDNASVSNPGVVTTGTQSFAGRKTLAAGIDISAGAGTNSSLNIGNFVKLLGNDSSATQTTSAGAGLRLIKAAGVTWTDSNLVDDAPVAGLYWDNANSRFTFGNGSQFDYAGVVKATTFIGALTGNASGTASALAANGSNCSGGVSFALGVDASGVGECGTIQDASGSVAGVVSTGTQTIAGSKTFSSTITGNVNNSAGDLTAVHGDGVFSVREAIGDTPTYTSTTASGVYQFKYSDLAPTTQTLFTANASSVVFKVAVSANSGGTIAATTAAALASNPSDCSANNFATTIAANGNLTCAQPAFSDLSGSATDGQIPNNITIDLATAATTGTVTDDTATNATMYPLWVTATSGNLSHKLSSTKLTFNPSTGTLTSTAFSGPLTGAVTGNASTATALAANPSACPSNQFVNDIAADGTLTCAALVDADVPNTLTLTKASNLTTNGIVRVGSADGTTSSAELSGDATTSGSNAVTVAKVNGVAFSSGPSTDTTPVITAANTATYKALPDCDDSGGNHLNYDTTTHAFSCGTSGDGAGSGSPGGSDTYVQFNDGSAFGGDAGLSYNKTTDVLTATGGLVASGSNGGADLTEGDGSGLTAAASHDLLWADSTAHRFKVNFNNGGATTLAAFTDKLSVFAATSSSELAGVLSNETGSANAVFSTNPNFDSWNQFTNVAAPASPSAGSVRFFADSTDLRFHDKNAAGTIGTTVVADTGSSNNFLTAISAAGVVSKAQPTEANLSLSDITTNDVSTTKHGLAPKAPNNTTTFLRGDATWATPVAGVAFGSTGNFTCTNGGGTDQFLGQASSSTTETSVIRFVAPVAGTVSAVYYKSQSNVPASQTGTVTVMKNTSAQTVTCSIAAAASTCNDTAHSFTFVAGDLIDVKVNCAGGTSAWNGPHQVGINIK